MHIAGYGQNVSTTELPVFCIECLFHVTLSTVYYGHVWTQSQNVLIICSIALVLEHY